MKTKRRAFTAFGMTLLAIFAFVVFFYTAFRRVDVRGESMMPHFKNGQTVLASNAYWLVGQIKDGDVVVIKGENPGEYIIKRVYKLGGEVVDWTNVPRTWRLSAGEYRVPDSQIYVLGDNRPVSEDSRFFGPVALDRVIGKVVAF